MYDGPEHKCCKIKENRVKLREKCKRLKSELDNGSDMIRDPSVDEDKKINGLQNEINTLSTTLMNVQQSHDKLVDQNRALSLECSSLKDEIKDLFHAMKARSYQGCKLKKERNRGINKAKDTKITH